MRDNHALSLSELYVPDGGRHCHRVRWELFIFSEVRDVLATSDRDRVLVVHRGAAQPDLWLQALSEAGLETSNVGAPANPRFNIPVGGRDRGPMVRLELRRRRRMRVHRGRFRGRRAPADSPSARGSGLHTVISFLATSPGRWSATQRRAAGAALAVAGLGLALAVGAHVPLLALGLIVAVSLVWFSRSLWYEFRCETRRSKPASAGLIVYGEVPIMRFHDDEPRVLCLGWLQPSVYVSTGALFDLPNEQLHAALAHQRHHAQQRDSLRLLVAQALADGLPFLPVLSSLVAGYRRRVETLAALMTMATVASLRPDLRGLPPCHVTGVAPLADRAGRGARLRSSAVAWTIASLVALAALVLHGVGVIALSSPDPTALGGQLCLIAAITMIVVGAATAVRGATPAA